MVARSQGSAGSQGSAAARKRSTQGELDADDLRSAHSGHTVESASRACNFGIRRPHSQPGPRKHTHCIHSSWGPNGQTHNRRSRGNHSRQVHSEFADRRHAFFPHSRRRGRHISTPSTDPPRARCCGPPSRTLPRPSAPAAAPAAALRTFLPCKLHVHKVTCKEFLPLECGMLLSKANCAAFVVASRHLLVRRHTAPLAPHGARERVRYSGLLASAERPLGPRCDAASSLVAARRVHQVQGLEGGARSGHTHAAIATVR